MIQYNSYLYCIVKGFSNIDRGNKHGKDVFCEWSEEFNNKGSLKAGHSQGYDDNPKTNPSSPGEKFHLRVKSKLVQGFIKHHQWSSYTWGVDYL